MVCESGLDFPSTSEIEVAVVSCKNPKFIITCNSKTISFIKGVLSCRSADGERYAVTDKKFLKDEKCRVRYGENGESLDGGTCGCAFPTKLYEDKCMSWVQVCENQFGKDSIPGDSEWEEDWTCTCKQGFFWDEGETKKKCVKY